MKEKFNPDVYWNKHPFLHKLAVIFVACPVGIAFILSELIFGGVRGCKKATDDVVSTIGGVFRKYPITKPVRRDNFYHV